MSSDCGERLKNFRRYMRLALAESKNSTNLFSVFRLLNRYRVCRMLRQFVKRDQIWLANTIGMRRETTRWMTFTARFKRRCFWLSCISCFSCQCSVVSCSSTSRSCFRRMETSILTDTYLAAFCLASCFT